MFKMTVKLVALVLIGLGAYSYAFAQNPQIAMGERKKEEPKVQTPAAQQPVAEAPYNIKTITTVPDGHRIPKEKFLEESEFFSNQNVADPSLIFRARLPKGWTARENIEDYSNKMNPNFLTDIGRYFGPPVGDLRPFFSVEAKLLEDEYFAEDWFKSFAITNSYNLRAVKVRSYKEVDALYTALEGDSAYAVHARVVISGSLLFFIKFGVPVAAFDKFADLQSHAINSFELKEPNAADVEAQKSFSLLDGGYFYFPSSWYVKNVNFSDLDRLSVELHRVETVSRITFGQIFVRAIRKKQGVTLQTEAKNVVGEVERREWKVQKLLERTRVTPPTGFSGGLVEIYDLQVKERTLDQELWFSYYETDSYYIFVSMYTPMREISFADWAKNKAVFYLVLRNFFLPKK